MVKSEWGGRELCYFSFLTNKCKVGVKTCIVLYWSRRS